MTVTWWKRSMFLKSRTSKPTGSDNSPIKTHPRRHCYGGWKVHQQRNIRRNSIIHKFPLPMVPPTTFQERLLENPRETGELCMQRNWPTMYASRRPYWLTPILPALTWNTVKFFSSSFLSEFYRFFLQWHRGNFISDPLKWRGACINIGFYTKVQVLFFRQSPWS